MRFRAFLERVGSRIQSLESVDYFKASEHFSGRKKLRRILMSKTSMVRLTGRPCKLSLYANESCDEHAVYFWR